MKETVLITGISGFIGQHSAACFLSRGFDVVGIDIKPAPFENIKYYKVDISDNVVETVFLENKIDYIVHLAAQSSVPFSVNYPVEDAISNYIGSIKICSLAKKYNIKRLLAASTAAVYAHPRYLPVKETNPPNCLSPYAITKQAMEYYIAIAGIDYTILRFSNVYGPGQNKKGESGVISIFIDSMLNNQDVKIYGDGEQIRDFIYVEDIVNAMYKAIINENCKNKIINISSNKALTINELFNKLKEPLKYNKSPLYLPEREGDVKNSILDNSLAKELFGFELKYDIDVGLAQTIDSITKSESS